MLAAIVTNDNKLANGGVHAFVHEWRTTGGPMNSEQRLWRAVVDKSVIGRNRL